MFVMAHHVQGHTDKAEGGINILSNGKVCMTIQNLIVSVGGQTELEIWVLFHCRREETSGQTSLVVAPYGR